MTYQSDARSNGQVAEGAGFPEVHHIGFVVADLDHALQTWGGGLGFGPAHVIDADLPMARLPDGSVGFKLRVGFVWTGNLLLEFLQPIDERSPHAAFLNEHGEGLHHLGFLVPSVDDALRTIGATAGGRTPALLVDALSGAAGGISMCYVEGAHAHGAVIELIERTPTAEDFLNTIYAVTGGLLPADSGIRHVQEGIIS